jgi:hypothetical protein
MAYTPSAPALADTAAPAESTVSIALADNPDLQDCQEGEVLNVVSNDGTTLVLQKEGYGEEGEGGEVTPDQEAIADRAMAMPMPRR